MAELLGTVEHTESGEEGWRVTYLVRREDGEEIEVDASCTNKADSAIRSTGDGEGLAGLNDRGKEAALRFAEEALPGRGPTRIRLSFDLVSGSLRASFDYTWPPPVATPS